MFSRGSDAPGASFAQVNPGVPATTAQHTKQVIGYITQWDAWKEVANVVPKGGYNHLNVDYSQYTILNFSFFGVASLSARGAAIKRLSPAKRKQKLTAMHRSSKMWMNPAAAGGDA